MSEKTNLKLIPLGGLNEIGKNMMVFEKDNDMIVIDCGVMFPDDEFLGLDYIIPDFSYVIQNHNKLKAIILTHGHEDHIGAVPFLLKEVQAPVYANKLTLGLVELKLNDHQLYEDIALQEINEESILEIGAFKIEFFRVNHSIPESFGIVIKTDIGTVIHSGDFKFDQNPIDNKKTDFSKIGMFGAEGVLALLSDSTNAEEKGYTLPERDVGKTLAEKFDQSEGRIIIATFSSHIHRIQQIMDVTSIHKRKLAISGKSLLKTIKISSDLGFLKIPDDLIIPISNINDYPEKKVAILSTGTQGEPLSALYKMAVNEHKRIQIVKGDTVIISASPIPGNEKAIANIINMLIKQGADVFYESIAGVHVSGHAAQEEIKMMINLVNPKYYIPVHGDNMHKVNNAKLAIELGIPEKNIIIAQNGDIIEINSDSCKITDNINMKNIYIDGIGYGEIDDIVLKDRKMLARDGLIFNILNLSPKLKLCISEPEIMFRGVTYMENFDSVIKDCKNLIKESVHACFNNNIQSALNIEKYINSKLEKYLLKKIRIKPVIMTKVIFTDNGLAE